MAQRKFQDRINLKKDAINLNITLITFEAEGNVIFYSPTLDLYGYGDNEGEALNSFNETMYLYLEYGMHENTIAQDLSDRGWTRHKRFNKRFNTEAYFPKEIMSEKGVENYGLYNVVDKRLQLQA